MMFDPCDVRDGNYVSQGFVFENIDNMIARTDEQVIRTLHAQCFSIRCVDSVRLEWSSLLQLSNFVRDHELKLAFSSMGDKVDKECAEPAGHDQSVLVAAGARREPLQPFYTSTI
jgi:hypothetical protein